MSKKVLSTWVSDETHKGFRDRCNEEGITLSEGLSNLVHQSLVLSIESKIEANPQTCKVRKVLEIIGKHKLKHCKHNEDGFCTAWSFSEEDKKELSDSYKFKKDETWDHYCIEVITQLCERCSYYEYELGYKYGEV